MILSIFSCNSKSQSVESPLYRVTLKTLLSHSVPESSVANVNLEQVPYILDTREKNEYDVSSIEGARFVGYNKFDIDQVSDIPKDANILLYCSVGYRSEKIAEKMKEAGWENVSNLYGGIFEWKNQDKPVVDSTGLETSRVHAFDKTWGRFLKKGEKVY